MIQREAQTVGEFIAMQDRFASRGGAAPSASPLHSIVANPRRECAAHSLVTGKTDPSHKVAK